MSKTVGMGTTIGIDLGTTNSVVATLQDGQPRAIHVDGSATMPSVVHYGADGRIVVGRAARNLALADPERTVSSVKRAMGRTSTLVVGGLSVRPEEASAEILRTLKAAAEAELGCAVTQAVITVPAYFDDAQRRATLVAGELAGLEVLRLVNEPTAAALVYERAADPLAAAPRDADADADASVPAGEPEIILVYDLGGGTFDVSVIEVVDGIREVRAIAGDARLGGDDFDECLVDQFVDLLHDAHGVDAATDVIAMARLRRAAEQAKISLSREVEVAVQEEFLLSVDGAPVHLRMVVTRRDFEAMIGGLLTPTIALAQRALDDARLGPEESLSRICLVGGSTRIPLVRRLLEESFAAEIHAQIDPDLAVGLGAALQCGMLRGEAPGRVLVDVASHTLGIRTADDFDDRGAADAFSPILHRNCALPAEATQEFYTSVDRQGVVQVDVLQGESARASRNRPIGTFEFPLRPMPQGSPVHIRFAYDLDGVIRVTASQPLGERMTVHLSVSDATPGREAAPTRAGTQQPDVPRRSDAAVARRARALLAPEAADGGGLDAAQRIALEAALREYDAADTDEQSEAAEDKLLDLFLELEAG